jgi:hypothetical protein
MKHINACTMCGENAEFSNVKWAIHIVLCFVWLISLHINQCYILVTKNSVFVECFPSFTVMKDRAVLSSYVITANLCCNKSLKYV